MSYIPNPSLLCEETVLSYTSSSLSGSGFLDPATQFFIGMADSDKSSPAVVIACNNAQEVYLGSRVYAFDVDITAKEIAYDNTTSSFRDFGGNIFALFGDPKLATAGINALQTGFNAYQVQVVNHTNTRLQDAWISNLAIKVVGCLAPPL